MLGNMKKRAMMGAVKTAMGLINPETIKTAVIENADHIITSISEWTKQKVPFNPENEKPAVTLTEYTGPDGNPTIVLVETILDHNNKFVRYGRMIDLKTEAINADYDKLMETFKGYLDKDD